MSGDAKKEMSISCRIDLSGVVKDIQGLKNSGIRPVSPIAAGPSLIELFAEEVRSLRSEGKKPSDIFPIFMTNMGLPLDGPLAKAGYWICLKVEEAREEPNYHNQHHILEVMLAAYVLGRREHLPIYRIAELIIAAAAHDLGHSGGMNKCDYELELRSCEIARPILQQAELTPEAIQRIESMILATDIRAGVPPTRNEYLLAKTLPPDNEQRLLATQKMLLAEADVLFSCFDLNYNDLLSKLLSAEWKRTQPNLSLKERLDFLKIVQFVTDASKQLGLEERRQILVHEISKSSTIMEIPKFPPVMPPNVSGA
jgi:hypothetical protein